MGWQVIPAAAYAAMGAAAEAAKAPPAVSGTGAQNSSVFVEGMRYTNGTPGWVWPLAIGAVAFVWLKGR